jgi:hypothetical protein
MTRAGLPCASIPQMEAAFKTQDGHGEFFILDVKTPAGAGRFESRL